MASIGSSPGVSSGPNLQVSAVSPVSSFSASADTGSTSQASDATISATSSDGTTVSTTALDAGTTPVDSDRVASIRKAIETGNYPIIPTKIGDAMIAAGMLLRV